MARIVLEDHFTAEEINDAVGRDAGFTEAFPGEAQAELDDLRVLFQRKALTARQARLCDELLAAGRGEADLVTLRLHELPPGRRRGPLPPAAARSSAWAPTPRARRS